MFSFFSLALLLAALAACGGHDELKKGTSDVTAAPPQYDMVLRADKDGQFDLEGATVNAEDLRSHIRYRNEPGNQAVHTLLLKTGEKEKIKNTHIATLAGIARDLKIVAYVEDNDGHLKVIQVVE
jgi:predicted small lipoprotein YifL